MKNHHAAGRGDEAMPIARDRSQSIRHKIVATLRFAGILLVALKLLVVVRCLVGLCC